MSKFQEKLAALRRFVNAYGRNTPRAIYEWRVERNRKGIRLPGSTERVILRNGSPDDTVFEETFLNGQYGPARHLCDKETVELVVDCGAHVGISALWFAQQFPKADVVAVEPEIENFRRLAINAKTTKRIRPIFGAISKEEGRAHISNPAAKNWSFRIDFDGGEEEAAEWVKTVTIPQILKDSGSDQVDILKIDIEGSELKLFDNNDAGWLRNVKLLIVELHERYAPGCTRALYEALIRETSGRFTQLSNDENLFVKFGG